MPPKMDSMPDDMDIDKGSDDLKMKLLGLTRLLEGIEAIAGEDLKPYIEDMINTAHMKHEKMESPEEESEEQEMGKEDDGGPMIDDDSKGNGIEIGIGMGKPGEEESEEDDEDMKGKPKGLLAILATRAKKPGMGKY